MREVERGLRVADRRAADAVRAERRQRHAVDGIRIGLARRENRRRRARRTCTARGARARTRPSRPPSCCPCERMPSTCQSSTTSYSDLCSRHMRWSITLSPSRTMQASMFQSATLTPLEKFQRPLSEKPPGTLLSAALRVGDARGDQRLRVLAPDLLLRALVVERQHPVVDEQVADVPAGRGAAARESPRRNPRRRRSRAPCRPSAWAAARAAAPVRCRSASVSGSMTRSSSARGARSRSAGTSASAVASASS